MPVTAPLPSGILFLFSSPRDLLAGSILRLFMVRHRGFAAGVVFKNNRNIKIKLYHTGILMAGNRWMWRGFLAVLLVAAVALVPSVAARNVAPATPVTWTLPPTPAETPTPEETPIVVETLTPEETRIAVETLTPEETLAAIQGGETPAETPTPEEETLAGITSTTANDTTGVMANDTTGVMANDTTGVTANDTTGETPVERGPPIVIGTDAVKADTTPVEASTAELPTFTPLQAAQVDSSPATPVPLSLTGSIVAVAIAGFLVVLWRGRK